jgi:hypothetical protein
LSSFDKRLSALAPDVLRKLQRGIEKESLRVKPDGKLADTPHPKGLGSALSHPHITTDFSEAQLELITGVHADVDSCLQQLTELHQVVYRNIGEELLWATSMPCQLPPEDRIPIGQYGKSNIGRLKTAYRHGPGAPVWPENADHFRHSLQLLAAGKRVADASTGRPGMGARPTAIRTKATLRSFAISAAIHGCC